MANSGHRTSLSIAIPSNRPLARSGQGIESAVSLCKNYGVELAVSDNSGEEEKKKHFENLITGDGLIYKPSPPCPMIENWFKAMNASEGDFVLMMGDDDRVMALGDLPDTGIMADDIVSIRPNVIAHHDKKGIVQVNSNEINAQSPMERIMDNLRAGEGLNMALCSFWRRDVFKPMMELHYDHHPTRGIYCDWAWVNALVSSGRVMRAPTMFYFYDVHNWTGNAEAVYKQTEKAFTSCGLPEGSAAYHRLFNAIDSFIYIARSFSPLSAIDKIQTAVICLNLYLMPFAAKITADTLHANSQEIYNIAKMISGQKDIHIIFDLIARLLAAIQPGLDTSYKAFYKKAVGATWGQVE